MNCNQEGCTRPAAFRFTWPGRDEAGICDIHAEKLKHVARGMGLHVQLIPLEDVGDNDYMAAFKRGHAASSGAVPAKPKDP